MIDRTARSARGSALAGGRLDAGAGAVAPWSPPCISPATAVFSIPCTKSRSETMGAWRRRRRAHPRRSCGWRWLREERLRTAADISLGETELKAARVSGAKRTATGSRRGRRDFIGSRVIDLARNPGFPGIGFGRRCRVPFGLEEEEGGGRRHAAPGRQSQRERRKERTRATELLGCGVSWAGWGLAGPLGQQATKPGSAGFLLFFLFFPSFFFYLISKAFLNRILRAIKFQQMSAAQK